jgi:alkylation response protein AidB-like acyl-CoA dehydrogenase
MNFDYTDEQNALRDSLSKWAAQQYDFEKRKAALKSEDGWKKNWATFAELGLLAAPLPEEYGGLGGGATEVAVVAEEFGKALVVEPFVPTVVLGAGALKYAGNAAQKEEHLNAIAAGERIIAFAQAEPKSRWALNDVSTTAKKSGAGYTLNGQKAVVLGAPQADYLLVSARTAGGQRDARGISLFLVPKSAKGVSTRDYPTMDDTRAAEVYFENVSVGAEALLGEADAALPVIEHIVDDANVAYCNEAVGCMRLMTSLTQDYAKQRKQFGKAIAEFQVIQHRLVDMFMATEECVSLALLATIKLDAGDEERARAVSSAKALVGKQGRFVGQAAVQIHGGMGVTDEMRVGHYFKRVTMIDATFGNVDTHLRRFAALTAKAAA